MSQGGGCGCSCPLCVGNSRTVPRRPLGRCRESAGVAGGAYRRDPRGTRCGPRLARLGQLFPMLARSLVRKRKFTSSLSPLISYGKSGPGKPSPSWWKTHASQTLVLTQVLARTPHTESENAVIGPTAPRFSHVGIGSCEQHPFRQGLKRSHKRLSRPPAAACQAAEAL